jgi:hypothetical protein
MSPAYTPLKFHFSHNQLFGFVVEFFGIVVPLSEILALWIPWWVADSDPKSLVGPHPSLNPDLASESSVIPSNIWTLFPNVDTA